MTKNSHPHTISNHKSIFAACLAANMLFTLSCTNNKRPIGPAIAERDSLPIMQTLGATSLISDSGVTRYRIEAEEWLIYDKKKPPYQAFEKGVYLEQFDTLFNVEASVKADTAYFYDTKKLWKLIGNVAIQNQKGEKFNTELLYWDQTTQKIYSDKQIRIEQPDRIIIGHGFEANQQMTIHTVKNIQGIFYIKEDTIK